MRISTRKPAGFVATVAAAGLAAAMSVGADPAAAQAFGPFTFTLSGSVAVSGPTTFAWKDNGTSDPMGNVTSSGTVTLTGVSLTCAGGLSNTHVQTLTATDGSSITITSIDVGCPTGAGTFQGYGDWTVTAATGRYAGATGYGTAVGGIDLISGTSWMNGTGTIVTR